MNNYFKPLPNFSSDAQAQFAVDSYHVSVELNLATSHAKLLGRDTNEIDRIYEETLNKGFMSRGYLPVFAKSDVHRLSTSDIILAHAYALQEKEPGSFLVMVSDLEKVLTQRMGFVIDWVKTKPIVD